MQHDYFNSNALIRMVRLAEVIRSSGLSRSSIYAGVKEGTFPKPVKIGKRSVAWSSEDISNWIAERINGGGK